MQQSVSCSPPMCNCSCASTFLARLTSWRLKCFNEPNDRNLRVQSLAAWMVSSSCGDCKVRLLVIAKSLVFVQADN
jgi:hypothetical protein